MPQPACWVTGATGRIGRDVATRLEHLGVTPVPLVLPGFPTTPKRVPWTAAAPPVPVNGPAELDALPTPVAVIHCHWLGDRSLGFAQQLALEVRENIEQLAFLWDRLRELGVAQVANLSTVRVFSHLNGASVDATTEPRPASPYGIAKLAGEHFLDAHFTGTATKVTHLRLATVVCHGGHPSQIASRLCAAAFHGEPVRILTGRPFQPVFIGDVVERLIAAALSGPAGRQTVAAPPLDTGDFARRFAQAAATPLPINYDTSPLAHPDPLVEINPADLPPTSLDEMLAALLTGHRAECP